MANSVPGVFDNIRNGTALSLLLHPDSTLFPYTVFWVTFLFICLMGIYVMRILKPGNCRTLLLHKRIGLNTKKRMCCGNRHARFFTFEFWTSMMSMTWGEFLAVLIYVLSSFITMVGLMQEGAMNHPLWFCVGSGRMTALSLMMSLIPVTKQSVWVHIFGIDFTRALRFHRCLSRCCLVIGVFHFISVFWAYGADVFFMTRDDTAKTPDGFFGMLSFLSMIVMAIFGIWRRKFYELFQYSHKLYILVVVCELIHVHEVNNYVFMIVPMALILLDKLIFLFLTCTKHRTTVEKITPLHKVTVLELSLKNKEQFKFNAGSYCFIMIPQISMFQWHPFSLSSHPDTATGNFSFHIKSYGGNSFSERLYRWAENESGESQVQESKDDEDPMSNGGRTSIVAPTTTLRNVYIDGPYGNLTVDLTKYRTIILCATDIGVTPLVSILSHLHKRRNDLYERIDKVTLIWTIANSEYITWFSQLFDKIRDDVDEDDGHTRGHRFEVRIYNTNKAGETQHPLGEWDEEGDVAQDMIGAMVGTLGQNTNELSVMEREQDEQESGMIELSGKPKFHDLFNEITGGARRPHEVVVIACDLETASAEHDAEYEAIKMKFHFHRETFYL